MIALLLLSCIRGPDPAPRGDCDPLDPALCALPWPSAFYLRADETLPSGWRVDLGPESLPVTDEGLALDPWTWNERDGFSILGPILAYFEDLDPAGLPGPDALDAYDSADAPVALIDVSTGARVPVWAELDGRDPAHPLLVLQPAVPLADGTRHVVGIRNLSRDDGAPIEASAAFAALRDDAATDDWDVEVRRDHFDAVVFPALEAQGFAREELQLAWDFVTASAEHRLARPRAMMDDALASTPPEGPPYAITAVEDHDCAVEGVTIGRTVEVTFTAPRYTVDDGPGTLLSRGDDGLPVAVGTTEVGLLVRVPCSVLADPAPAFALQYGHGLLQSRDELRQDYLGAMLDRHGWVGFAVDWPGLSSEDVPAIAALFTEDPSNFAQLPERTMQAFVQQELALTLVRGALAEDAALQVDGVGLIDPARFGFWGNSAGGILGGAYGALSPSHQRVALGVSGTPFTLVLPRSVNFDPFLLMLQNRFGDDRDIKLLVTAFQTLWDPAEAAGWTRVLAEREVLLQVGIGDAQVTTLGGQVLARALGTTLVDPPARAVWGLEAAEAPFAENAYVEWRYVDGAEEPAEAVAPSREGDAHLCPRREAAAQDQLRDFLEEGVIEQHCDGVCEGVVEGLCD
ncbi:MAG: hypothetical protein H6739_32870 [Alphaproteobacteria bacterium]|nr:hypothetical protein [Alphaproteobacteria bacterium]